MKRPLGVVAMAVVGLCTVVGPVHAQSGTVSDRPDAGWSERDYLLHYASTICVRAAYATLKPAPATVLDTLAQEAWAMVEFTKQAPAIYDRIHTLASEYGDREAPARALAGCDAWTEREADVLLEGAKLAD